MSAEIVPIKDDECLKTLQSLIGFVRTDAYALRSEDGDYKPIRCQLDTSALMQHLNGGPHTGVYILVPGASTTRLAALDLDDHEGSLSWPETRDIARRIALAARRVGLDPWAVRSGGGHGIHFFFMWDADQPTAAVRKALAAVLAREGFSNGTKGVAEGEVEIFPKQDRVEEGKFGNLIALPFGRRSVPLDEMMEPAERPRLCVTSAPISDAPGEKTERDENRLTKGTMNEVRSALGFLNADDYDGWIEVGLALKNSFGHDGFGLWDSWSSKSAKYPGKDKLRERWLTFKARSGSDAITVGTIFHLAGKAGWSTPRRSYALTDIGNGERLVDRYGEDMMYIYAWRSWLVWDGTRFCADENGGAIKRAKETVTAIYKEASDVAPSDPDRAKLIARWAAASQQKPRVEAALFMAQSDLSASAVELDCDDLLFNLNNGTLDLRTLTLSEHRRADRLTKVAPVNLYPDAKCPLWEAFLKRIYKDDDELIKFIQRAVGYSLTGETGEQVLFLLHGSGANGKSTLLETLQLLLGDYARPTEFRTLLERENSDAVRNDLAALCGLRLVTAIEVGRGKRLDEAMVKQVTGGDKITARFLHKEFFDFKPRFKLWLAANNKPDIRGTDEAIWRRVILIPHEVTIPAEERDPALSHKLSDELPGILNWAVDGLRAWKQMGLRPPEGVLAATKEYRREMDILSDFIEARCVLGPKEVVPTASLYHAYEVWCETNGEDAVKKRTFGIMLKERGFRDGVETISKAKQRVKYGLGLTDQRDAECFEEVPF